jgi:hypothetical protein
MGSHKCVEIVELKPRPMMRTTNYPQPQRARRSFIGTEYLGAFDFLFAIQPNYALPDRRSGSWWAGDCDLQASAENCVNNLSISRAPAEHAADRVHDLNFAGSAISAQERGRSDQHSWRARAALRRSVRQERFLQAVIKRRTLRQSLNRYNFASCGLPRRYQTRTHRVIVEQDGTGATIASVAADFSSGQTQVVAEYSRKPRRRRRLHFHLAAVYGEGNQRRRCVGGCLDGEILPSHHQRCPAQASSARRTRTSDASRRYSAVARTSSIGESGDR